MTGLEIAHQVNKQHGDDIRESMVGKKVGFLNIIANAGRQLLNGQPRGALLCECYCGERKLIRYDMIKDGKIKSCGCEATQFDPNYRHEADTGYVTIRIPGWPDKLNDFQQEMVERKLVNDRGLIFEHRYNYMIGSRSYIDVNDSVHHKNGKRNDNTYSNLEHWTGNHLHGVRKEDMNKWVINYIKENPHILEVIND